MTSEGFSRALPGANVPRRRGPEEGMEFMLMESGHRGNQERDAREADEK